MRTAPAHLGQACLVFPLASLGELLCPLCPCNWHLDVVRQCPQSGSSFVALCLTKRHVCAVIHSALCAMHWPWCSLPLVHEQCNMVTVLLLCFGFVRLGLLL